MRLAILTSASALLLLLACSEKSEFKGSVENSKAPKAVAKDADTAKSTPPEPVPVPEADTPADIVDICTSGQLKTIEQTLTYPKRVGCDFSEAAGNLPPLNGSITALHTTLGTLKMPEKGVLCDISITSDKNARFVYDDMLIFSMDDKVLFSSTLNLKPLFTEVAGGVYSWKREDLLGKAINFKGEAYCLGEDASCVMPRTEEKGPIAITLPIGKILPIVQSFGDRKDIPLNLTAMGDNDPFDCSHEDLVLYVTMKFTE